MYFISYKCAVGEVGMLLSAVCDFFWSHLTKPDNVVSQFILTPLSISLDLPLPFTITDPIKNFFKNVVK